MPCSDSRVDRSTSVSSMRRTKRAAVPAREQPVEQRRPGVADVQEARRARCEAHAHDDLRSLPALGDEHDRVHRHRLAAADGVDALVGLALDADARRLDAQHGRPGWRGWPRGAAPASAARRSTTASTLTTSNPASRRQRHGMRQHRQARRALPPRVGVREVPADVAPRDGAEDGVGDGVRQHVRIRVAGQPLLARAPSRPRE